MIEEIDPSIIVEARYFGSHNFIGKQINGYKAPKCLLTRETATALAAVQAELQPFALSLKVYDCYRPQQAVDHFVAWAKDLADAKMKKEFYPAVEKKTLFADGYIASKSGHSRGSTVDLTIVPVPAPSQPAYTDGQPLVECFHPAGSRYKDNSLDMGTGYDCFSPLSHTASPRIVLPQKANRLLLKTLMEKHGFTNYDKEWWHYTLQNEPFPKRYFNFSVE
ncbi:MAG: M15 family metallopeptidase [Deltaproteobacteria bacterium]|nr:M15 family metallopeptidase [Deltaproteobacteria bacterium]